MSSASADLDAPLISIITPVYNAERFIAETLKSVQGQSHQNWEQILVFDAKSNDQSLQIAQEFAAAEPRIRILQNPLALGVATNRNLGLEVARGEFVTFLDSDDLWPPTKLSQQLRFSQDHKFPFTFTAFQRMSEDGKTFSPATQVPAQVKYQDLLKLNVIAIHTVLLRRSFLAGRRFPKTVHEDFALWLELLRDPSVKAYGLNEPLAYYRSVAGSLANNKIKAALWRWKILREQEKLSLGPAIYYFIQYAVRALRLHQKTSVQTS